MKDRNGKTLKAGQIFKVHPSKTSTTRKPYEVSIEYSNMGDGGLMTVGISHNARINEYLRKRLEIIKF